MASLLSKCGVRHQIPQHIVVINTQVVPQHEAECVRNNERSDLLKPCLSNSNADEESSYAFDDCPDNHIA